MSKSNVTLAEERLDQAIRNQMESLEEVMVASEAWVLNKSVTNFKALVDRENEYIRISTLVITAELELISLISK